jgi:hypothetical protein
MSAAEGTPNDPPPSGGDEVTDEVTGDGPEPAADLDECDLDECDLDEEVNTVAGHLNALHARLVDLTVTMIANPRSWRGPGVHTPELFLAWRTGLSARRARQIVAVAERVHELPHCIDAFRRGELSIDQMASIARRAPWWTDREICNLGRMLTVSQLDRTLATYPFPFHPHPDAPTPSDDERPSTDDPAADDTTTGDQATDVQATDVPSPDDPTTGDQATDDRVTDEGSDSNGTEPAPDRPQPDRAPKDRMWFGIGDDGRFRLDLETDALTGKIIETALREARDQLFQDGHPDLEWPDAIREVCERSLDTISDPARRDRFRIHVHLKTDGQCCDDRGWNLPDAVRRYITCDGLLTPTFIDGSIPISVGRTGRTIPQRTRRLVMLRDGGCAVPGCTQTHVLEIHHIIHWENGGPTDTWNLITLCPHHHRMHHKGELGISGNADDGTVAFTDGNGAALRPTGAKPKPPGAPPPPPPSRYIHPLGERLDTDYLYFREPNTGPSRAA